MLNTRVQANDASIGVTEARLKTTTKISHEHTRQHSVGQDLRLITKGTTESTLFGTECVHDTLGVP